MKSITYLKQANLGFKLNLIIGVGFAVLLIIIVILLNISVQNLTTQTGRQRAIQEVEVITKRFLETEQALLADLNNIAYTPGLASAVEAGDTTNIDTIVTSEAESFNFEHLDIVDLTGKRVYESHSHIVTIAKDNFLKIALQNEQAIGVILEEIQSDDNHQTKEVMEHSPESITLHHHHNIDDVTTYNHSDTIITNSWELELSAVTPLLNDNNEVVGGVLVSHIVNNRFLNQLNFNRQDVKFILFRDNQILAQSTTDDLVMHPADIFNATVINKTLNNQTTILDELVKIDDHRYGVAYTPLTINNRLEGGIVVMVAMDKLLAFQRRLSATAILAMILLWGIIVLLVARFAHQNITKPIGQLQKATQYITQGDVFHPLAVKSDDEVGHLAQAFNEMITAMQLRETALAHAKTHAETANQAKSTFLANMSHELRTPLNGILGYTQILTKDPQLTPDQRSGVQVIHQSGEHLLTLINDILDLSKIEAGQMEIVSREFFLSHLLNSLVNIFRLRTEEKGLVFYYQPPPNLPQFVYGDEKRLRQVLTNLLGNAIKFTEQGQITLKILSINKQLAEYPDNPSIKYDHQLRFEVIDSGIGIASDKLSQVFQPFKQVDEGRLSPEGTGLGLSISQQLVIAMGSKLQVSSMVGQGSRFWFDLTLPELKGRTQAEANSKPAIVGYQRDKPFKILVVDDMPEDRALVINMLQPLGFEMQEANNGHKALDAIRTFKPDIILMDIVMPEMDGLEATKTIRQTTYHPEIIIITTSASAFEDDRHRSLEAGCNDFIPKPLYLETLLQYLETYLQIVWVYQTDTSQPSAQAPETPLIIPPKTELEVLFNLALRGKLKQLTAELARIETTDATYIPFVKQVQALADTYKMKSIRKLLKSYLEEVIT